MNVFSMVHKNSRYTVVPGFRVLGFRALCTRNQIWIYVINLPGFSALPEFKAPFHGDGQSALNPGTTVLFRETKGNEPRSLPGIVVVSSTGSGAAAFW